MNTTNSQWFPFMSKYILPALTQHVPLQKGNNYVILCVNNNSLLHLNYAGRINMTQRQFIQITKGLPTKVKSLKTYFGCESHAINIIEALRIILFVV